MYRKGQKIKMTRDCSSGGFKRGDVFTLTRDHEWRAVFVDNDGDYRSRNDGFEPLPVAAEAQPAAQEPAAELKIEAGKFKVGDRVSIGDRHPYILAPSQMSGLVKDVNATTRRGPILVEIDNYSGSLHFLEDELSIVKDAPSAPVAAPVAAQVDVIAEEYGPVVVSDNEANDDLIISISLDTGNMHEELDELIAKLKKVRKLQRQVGLAA